MLPFRPISLPLFGPKLQIFPTSRDEGGSRFGPIMLPGVQIDPINLPQAQP